MSLLNDGAARFGPFSAGVVEVAVLSGERLLIVEEEFLIALDIQRVVEDANARKTVFARSFIELRALDDRLHEFDLAIVTPPRPGTSDWSIADRLVAAGPAGLESRASSLRYIMLSRIRVLLRCSKRFGQPTREKTCLKRGSDTGCPSGGRSGTGG